MSPLNYSRLIISMSNLLENLDSKLYQGTSTAYRADIELAIRSAIEAAQKSVIRDPFIFTPVELKRWLEGEFDAINSRHNVRTPDIVSNPALDDLAAAVDEAAESVLADAANEAASDDSAVELTSAAPRTGLKRMNALRRNPPRAARRARTARAAGETMLHQARAAGVRKLAPFRRPVMNTVVRDRVLREVEEDEEDAVEAAEALMVLSQHVPRGAAALPPIPDMHVSVRGAFVEGARYAWQVREREEFGDVGFVEMVEEKVGVKGRSFWEVI